MQIKATKEVREYQTVVYFGLTMRQLIFAALAGGLAVLCWALLRNKFSMDTISFICILIAAPLGAFGFIRWHGMYLEQLIPVLFRSKFLLCDTLYFRPQNKGKELIIEYMKEERKGKKHASKRKESKNEAER